MNNFKKFSNEKIELDKVKGGGLYPCPTGKSRETYSFTQGEGTSPGTEIRDTVGRTAGQTQFDWDWCYNYIGEPRGW